jgi:hypothetical protein
MNNFLISSKPTTDSDFAKFSDYNIGVFQKDLLLDTTLRQLNPVHIIR